MALGLSVLSLVSGTAAYGQTTVIQQPPPPPPQQQTVVVPTPAQAAAPAETETTYTSGATLIASGLVTFGLAYGGAAIVASQSDHKGDNRLYIPIVGPWMDLAERDGCDETRNGTCNETTNKVLLVIDGVFQGAGVLAVLGGVLYPGETTTTRTVAQKGFHVVPTSYGHGAPGLAAFGTF